jgi:glycosyltransferase involved in cell wall biosynthesis
MVAPTSFFADYGCHVRILEEARALLRLGHKVCIATYHNGNDVPGLEIRRTPDVPWVQREMVGSSRHKIYLDAMLLITSLRAAISFRPSIVHAHLHEGALIGSFLKRSFRIPLIFDYQGSLTEEMIDHRFLRRDGPYYRPMLWLEKRINSMADMVVTSSYNAATRLVEHFLFPQHKLQVLPDGVDTKRFRPPTPTEQRDLIALKEKFGIPAEAPVVVYLGLLAPYQGTDLLLEAAALVLRDMPEVRFLVMGYPGVERYRGQSERLGISHRVVFTGRIPFSEAHRYLALGDVAVSPKMSLTEGAGKVANYMAMGLPVVAFDNRVHRELLGDLGFYARSGDPASLAAAILQALSDKELSARQGREGRRRAVELFSWDAVATRLEQIYTQLGAHPDRGYNLAEQTS